MPLGGAELLQFRPSLILFNKRRRIIAKVLARLKPGPTRL
jgi:hypothetical protein